jgi:hypothetical protein
VLEGHVEGYWYLALALFQGLLGLAFLLGFPKGPWNRTIGALFVLNGLAALGIAGITMGGGEGWSRLLMLADPPTVFLLLFFALTFPRPLLGPRSVRPLAAVLGAYVLAWWGLILVGHPWTHASGLVSMYFGGLPTYLSYAIAVPVLTYHLVTLRDAPKVAGQVAILLAVLVLRTGLLNDFTRIPAVGILPESAVARWVHAAVVVASVGLLGVLALRGRGPSPGLSLGVIAAFVVGHAASGLEHALYLPGQPPLNRLDLFLVRPLLMAYALARFQVAERPNPAARPLLAAMAASLVVALAMGIWGLAAWALGGPPNDPLPLVLALAAVVLLAAGTAAAGAGGFGGLAFGTSDGHERLEQYRHAMELAILAEGAMGLDGGALEKRRRALGISDLQHRLLRSELLDSRGAAGPRLSNRYLLERTLAETPTSSVALAVDRSTGAQVALKRLRVPGDARARKRLLAEARILKGLRHERIVRLHEVVGLGDDVYLAMEYVPGGDLGRLLAREGRLDPARALALGRDVLEGLAAAHTAGVAHRDLKPANVLLDAQGRARVADFGTAIGPGAGEGTAATLGGWVGTPLYMAPEQARGQPGDARSDVHAAGVLLHVMLTGKHPWAEHAGDGMVLLQRAARGVEGIDRSVHPALAPILRRALQPDPRRRYHDASAMLQALPATLPPIGKAPPARRTP